MRDVEHGAEVRDRNGVRTDRLPDAAAVLLASAGEAVGLPPALNKPPVAHAVALAAGAILNT